VIARKQQHGSNQRRFIAAAVGGCLAAALVGLVPIASAQDQSTASPGDAIVARKTMMDTLSDHMDQIEAMIAANKINLKEANEHADTISVMLMAFPHLFPASTNQWKAGVDPDPVTGTFASPDVWTKFADFYKRATDASKAAYDMSRAEKADDLKAKTAQLRTDCNGCHAQYLKMQ
jgi:cytochrome c556